MKGTVLTIDAAGLISSETFCNRIERPDLLQKIVGGYIEVVPGFDTIEVNGKIVSCVAFANEEGKLAHLSLPHNHTATALWERALRRRGATLLLPNSSGLSDHLVGSVALVYGDAAFIASL
jgi:hypothetical protein